MTKLKIIKIEIWHCEKWYDNKYDEIRTYIYTDDGHKHDYSNVHGYGTIKCNYEVSAFNIGFEKADFLAEEFNEKEFIEDIKEQFEVMINDLDCDYEKTNDYYNNEFDKNLTRDFTLIKTIIVSAGGE